MRRGLLILTALLIAGGCERKKPQTVAPATAPATAPSTAPVALTPPPRPKEYMDVVRDRFPKFPTTHPLMAPVALNEAAKLIMTDPMYIDFIGDLWITRADAEATSTVFKTINDQSTHVTRENVVFVHRWPDERGVWQPQLICKKPAGGYEIVTRAARQDIVSDHAFDWARAYSWNDVIVVPTDRGISILRPDRRPMEIYHEFIPATGFDATKYSQVQAMLDWRGLVAWMPWDGDKAGSHGAARFVNDKWTDLNAWVQWPERIIHLIPLLDGSVLRITLADDGTAEVSMAVLDPADVPQEKIVELVAQLSSVEAEQREKAFDELTRYGSGIWPILEKLAPNQGAEAQIRLEQLLSAKRTPMLGSMVLAPGPVKVVGRSNDGAALLYTDAGVIVHDKATDAESKIAPAIISIQPGRAVELVTNTELMTAINEPGHELRIVHGEWILTDPKEGPRWWVANHFGRALLQGAELEFSQLIGQDGRGRWLFRKNLEDSTPTLVLDPTLPDPTPRFPVWLYHVEGGEVGWTPENWPAVKSGGALSLREGHWQAIDEAQEKFTWSGEKQPETNPPTSMEELGPAILVDTDGTRFYDGQQALRVIGSGGKDITWKLPPEAQGSGKVTLIHAGESGYFLFNKPARVLRLRATPEGPEPFVVDGTFTHRIPDEAEPNRIWLDPAGRIIIAFGGNTLAICFPNGRIPRDLANIMPSQELIDAEGLDLPTDEQKK